MSTVLRPHLNYIPFYKIPIDKSSEASKTNSTREQKTVSFYNISKFIAVLKDE